MIQVGSDFSGVGAFNQALMRLNIEYKEAFACDMDKYARETFIHNYGELSYYPKNVYDREIPKQSLDIYMTSPPCQAFSLAGKRKGEDDKRGILFYNSHEFIQVNKPRYFIFENVKGLLSDAKGRTFQIWLDMLGGKSVNGNPVIFPREDATPYHIYYKVLNAKNYGVPQNRERVFIIGIRDDSDNTFYWPKKQHLTKRLKDVLENEVDEKYYLSEKAILGITNSSFNSKENIIQNTESCSATLPSRDYKDPKCIKVKSATKKGFEIANEGDSINLSNLNSETRRGRVGKEVAQTLDTACNQAVITYDIPEWVNVRKYEVDVKKLQKLLKKNKTLSNQKIALELKVNKTTVDHWFRTDSGFSIPDANLWFALKKLLKIDTDEFDKSITLFELKESVYEKSNRVYDTKGIAPTLTSTSADERILMGAIRGRNPENPLSREVGLPTEQRLELNMNGTANALTTVQKDNVVVYGNLKGGKWDKTHEQSGRVYDSEGIGATIHTMGGGYQEPKIYQDYNIRRLTPRECFRLMDFPDTFTWPVSNSQAYKQAGNSIVVNVLAEIIKKLNLEPPK